MPRSTATTAEAYLAELPPERAQVIDAVRKVVVRNLPDGYEEVMRHGMICWELPLARYPKTYNGEPLLYAALAAQARHNALYLQMVYSDPALEEQLRAGFAAAGKKLDLGKSCLRFRSIDDLALLTLAKVIAAAPPGAFIAAHERARGGQRAC